MASIADIYVTVMPETSRIADGIARAFREVDPKAAEAGRRWGQEIQRGIGEARVELKADTSKARAEIDEASKDKKATVELDADTAKAEAQIDVAARDRKATIEVDADTLVSSAQRSFSQMAPAFAGVGTQLSQSLASGGASAATSVSGSLSGAMGPVGTALTVALVGGAVTAAAGVAAALSGVIGLIPAGLGGGIGVLGTLVTGLDGVKDAWDAAGKAADSSGKDQEEKAKSVAAAQRSLRNAVLDEANAQKDVANARRDARQQLEDLNVQLRGGVIDEKQAILDAQAARRDLATGRFRDSIEYQQAQLRVQQADQRVLEAHERNVQLQQKANDANTKGVDQSDQVVAANQRLAKAHEDVTVAQQNLTEAQSKHSSTADAFAQAMGKLSPNAQAFINTLQGLKPAWEQLKFAVQDSLFAGIGPELQRLASQYLPVLKDAMSGLAGTMNTAFKDIGAWLSKPEVMAQIKEIVANIGSSFKEWAQSLVPFSNAFLTITKVGSGFLPGLGKAITEGANAFNNFIQQAAKSGELQNWMRTGIQALGELIRMMPILGKLFLDLAPIGIPVLRTLNGLLMAMEPLFRMIGIAGGQYQTGVNQFWAAIGRLADKFIEVTKVVAPPLIQIMQRIEQVFQRVFGTISRVVENAWKIIKPIFDKISIGGVNISQALKALSHLPGMGDLNPGDTASATPGAAASGGDGASLPSLSSLRGQGLTMPFAGGPLPKRSEMSGHAPRPWLLNDPDYSGPTASTTAAMPGDSPLVAALTAKGFSPQMIRLILGFSKVEGNNPSGTPTLGFTDAQLGGATDLQSHVDALAQQFKNRASVAGPFPEGGTDQQQAQWIAAVVGQSGLSSDWQGNSQPKDYVQRVMAAMGGPAVPGAGLPGASASMPGGINLSGALPDVRGAHPQLAYALKAIEQLFPGLTLTAGDYDHPKDQGWHGKGQAIDIGGGTPELRAQLANWLLQFAPEIEELINKGPGVTQNIKSGKLTPAIDMPGSIYNTGQAGDHSDHVHLAITDQQAQAFVGALGGNPALPNINGMAYPSAMMPTIAAPGGISPDGTYPLGTQNSPFYVKSAQSSGAEQLGQDFVSGIAEVFGFDGTLFKNPLDSGLFKGFKGLMSFLTGGGKGRGQGMPASYWQAQGGDGAAMPAMGGGDLFAGLGGMLQGVMPQPFGQITKGGPAQAPDEFQPMLPGSGGNATLPSNFTPSGNKTVGGPQIDQSINIGTVNGNPQSIHQTMVDVNVPRARQGVNSIPGMN